MRGLLAFAYGAICYAVFLLSFLYAVGFVNGALTPTTIDHGLALPEWPAWPVDLALLALFALQHSGMARRGFKHWLKGWLPVPVERSTYVLLTSLSLLLLFALWRPLPGTFWSVQTPWARSVIYALAAMGWLIVFSGTFVINHFDLFGLRQVWFRLLGRPYAPPPFVERGHYRLVRHPLMLGFIIAFWATPDMSTGHLLFAVGTTGYILLALQLEERDLMHWHGEDYARYRQRVPMLCPWPRPHARKAKHRHAAP